MSWASIAVEQLENNYERISYNNRPRKSQRQLHQSQTWAATSAATSVAATTTATVAIITTTTMAQVLSHFGVIRNELATCGKSGKYISFNCFAAGWCHSSSSSHPSPRARGVARVASCQYSLVPQYTMAINGLWLRCQLSLLLLLQCCCCCWHSCCRRIVCVAIQWLLTKINTSWVDKTSISLSDKQTEPRQC